ncbi:MAG: carbohydrate ABC transporter substrate-binding protein [Anaerolineae bacterium]|nr:carbohydrate ABC transporter substrate-binding protein [Anaerolineae bacterium]
MKKPFTYVVLILIIATACTDGISPSMATSDVVVLWHPYADARGDALQALSDQFNQEIPNGPTLIVEYHQDLLVKIKAAPEDQRPDIVVVTPDELRQYHQEGLALGEVTLPQEVAGTMEELLPMASALYTLDGNLQAIPLGLATYVLYFNDNWLRDLGYTPGTAMLEDLRFHACAASDLSSGQVGLGIPSHPGAVLALLTASGATLQNPPGTYTFNGAEGQWLMTMLHDGLRASCIRTFNVAEEGIGQFSEGAMAMMIESSLRRTEIELAIAAESNFTLGLGGLPSITGPRTGLWYGPGLLLLTPEGPRREMAEETLGWFLTPGAQEAWYAQAHFLPVRRSVIEQRLAQENLARTEEQFLRLTLTTAEQGNWRTWPQNGNETACRAALVRGLLQLAGDAVPNAVLDSMLATCNGLP